MSESLGRILVLAGGLSHERDVSLRSGRRVADALQSAGCEVETRDVDGGLIEYLRKDPPACVVPMVHGENGEDGALREILELCNVPYVGAAPSACRGTFDKPQAKAIVAAGGIQTPDYVCLPHETFRELGAAIVLEAIVERLGLPLMVKPARSGSALGCTVINDPEQLPKAMVSAFAYGTVAILEKFIEGDEVAVAVIDEGAGPQAMPAVSIQPDGGVYDYAARYTAGATQFEVPAPLDPALAQRVAGVAVDAHKLLGLKDVSRADMIIDSRGEVWFLEGNVAPGFTETSTVPLALQAEERDLGQTFVNLIRAAIARRNEA